MADKDQRTEKPTGRRVEKARKEGSYAVSKDVITAGQFFVFVSILGAWFPSWLSGMKVMLRDSLANAFYGELNLTTLPGIAWAIVQKAFVPLSILGGLTFIVSLGLHLTVTKMGFSLTPFTPDFGRFDPLKKLKQIASSGPSSAMQAAAMLGVFGTTLYLIAEQNAEKFLSLPFASLEIGLQQVGASIKDLLWKAAAVFVVFGVIDFFRQRKKFTKSLKMTKKEVADELKDQEVSPQVKSKLRQMRRDLVRRKMMKDVQTATAVVVNPTHFAVALKYQYDSPSTPMVVAKGKNLIALRIRQIALENGVPLIENPPLARALYKSVEVGQEIPPALYRAVAEVLAYIYRLTNTRRPSLRRG